jgi:hypothetical protein
MLVIDDHQGIGMTKHRTQRPKLCWSSPAPRRVLQLATPSREEQSLLTAVGNQEIVVS